MADTLSILPAELCSMVIEYLPSFSDLVSLGTTSRYWRGMVVDPSLFLCWLRVRPILQRLDVASHHLGLVRQHLKGHSFNVSFSFFWFLINR